MTSHVYLVDQSVTLRDPVRASVARGRGAFDTIENLTCVVAPLGRLLSLLGAATTLSLIDALEVK